jgi:hypothetical protein
VTGTAQKSMKMETTSPEMELKCNRRVCHRFGGRWSRFNDKATPPELPGVYFVQVNLNGRLSPLPHEPALYSYWDGVSNWSSWGFSEKETLVAKELPESVRFSWREI